ncbi:MAG: DUF4244 domain-containing protein [Acidimicrobiales bacterium]
MTTPQTARPDAPSARRLSLIATRRGSSELGQATVEYALVVLAAAAVALLVIAWAARTGKVGELLDRVFDQVVARAG